MSKLNAKHNRKENLKKRRLMRQSNSRHLANDQPSGTPTLIDNLSRNDSRLIVHRPETNRSRRTPDEIKEFLENTQSLAIILSGIGLEMGLMDQSISATDALIGLFRMVGFGPDDIIGLSDQVLNGAFDALKKLSAADKGEEWAMLMDWMREEASSFKNLGTVDVKSYNTSLTAVKGLEQLKDSVEGIKISVGLAKLSLEELQTTKKIDDSNVSDVTDEMRNFLRNFRKIEEKAPSIKTIIEKIKEAKKILAQSEPINNFFKEQKLRADLEEKDSDVTGLSQNIQQSLTKAQGIIDAHSTFETIKKLADSRYKNNESSFQMLESADLDKLQAALEDTWIADHIPKDVIPHLVKTLLNFGPVSDKLKVVDTFWSEFDKESNRDLIDQITSISFQIASSQSQGIDTIVNGLKDCGDKNTVWPNTDNDKLKKLGKSVNKLNNEVNALSEFDYIDQLKDLSDVKDHFNLDGKNDEEKKKLAENVLVLLKSDERLINLLQLLQTFEADLDGLINFINNIKTNTNFNLDSLETHKTTINPFLAVYTCLEGINTNGVSLKQIIEGLRDARSLQVSSDAIQIFHSIVQSGEGLADGKAMFERFKDIKETEATTLKDAFTGDTISKLFSSVQGIQAINNVYNASGSLKGLSNLKKVNGLTPEQQKAVKDLDEIPKVIGSVDAFMKSSVEIKSKRSIDFSAATKVFEMASKVKGVNLDKKSLKEVLQKLKKSDQSAYDKTVPAMNVLETLDLDFSKYSIGSAASTLVALDQSLQKYGAAMQQSSKHGSNERPFDNWIIEFSSTTWPTQEPLPIKKNKTPFYLVPDNYDHFWMGIFLAWACGAYRIPFLVLLSIAVIYFISLQTISKIRENIWCLLIGGLFGSFGIWFILKYMELKERRMEEEMNQRQEAIRNIRRQNFPIIRIPDNPPTATPSSSNATVTEAPTDSSSEIPVP